MSTTSKLERCRFPDNFVWGTGTSAYQIEGAPDADGKGESIWDRFSHTPGRVKNNENGDIACDHYNRFEADIALARTLNLGAYRFSISWPRVQPTGRGQFNEKGLAFYDKLIDAVIARGMEPFITLYHWDLPQALQDEGGWANRAVGQLFAAYAAKMVERFGNRVKFWVTFNEPWCSAYLGHAWAVHAPGIADQKMAPQVAHNLLVAHGLATIAMRKAAPGPLQIGIVLNQSTPEPLHPEDAQKCEEAWRWDFGQWLDPLLKGYYPAGNAAQIYDLAADDLSIISQKIDYVGINYYFRNVISNSQFSHPLPGSHYTDMQWEVTPTALRTLLTRISREYDYPTLYVTENGAAYDDVVSADGRVHDAKRLEYLREHIKQVRLAIKDGARVQGYFAWSLMDNFEWAEGYSRRFGLIHIDYGTQKRTIKDSGLWFARTAKHNAVACAESESPRRHGISTAGVICAAALLVCTIAYLYLTGL